MQRHTSNSSASLFFGPSIPGPEAKSPAQPTLRPNHSTHRAQHKMGNRHTYCGNDVRASWEATPSKSPPFNPLPNYSEEDTDIDDFFSGPSDSSFAFTVIDSTPSRPRNPITFLPKKYKPRDSAVLFESDDDRIPSMPGASSSLSTMNSGDSLVTPVYPSMASGWPSRDGPPLVASHDYDLFNRDLDAYSRSEADDFIMRLLAGNTKPVHGKEDGSKRMPDTPVKKLKTTHFAVERPWQSAFTSKIGSEEFDYLAPPPGRGGKKAAPGKKPRKSLPAVFPALSGADAESPTERKDAKYAGLGLGRPRENPKNPKSVTGRTHWLMRRSSSGAFSTISSGSDTSATATPTRPKDKGMLSTRTCTFS